MQGAPLPTAAPEVADTVSPPELPSPEPTIDDWRLVGDPSNGPSIELPGDWVDLSDQSALPAIGNRLGINLLFAADSERTGRSMLAGKPVTEAAYASSLLATPPAQTGDLTADVLSWLSQNEPGLVPLTQPTPITSADGVQGAVIDVTGGPIGLSLPGQGELITRLAVFAPPAQEGIEPAWIAYLLSATSDRWQFYDQRFGEALRRARVGSVRRGVESVSGGMVVRGALKTDRDFVTATLEKGVSDVWTFTAAANRYASLFVQPSEPNLDATLTLFGPNRQTLAQIDKGFAGDGEALADQLLTEAGTYVVEVRSFFNDSGRYRLSLVLADTPQYSGGGPIEFGQAIQSTLLPNGSQYWIFNGSAGQRVSVVVEPAVNTLDAVLELLAPDGRQLVSLDEGFSGDPEVASGVELPAAGQYAIVVRSFSEKGGGYTISLDETGPEIANFYDAGDLIYGETRQESLQREEAHAWFFNGRVGDQVLIRAIPQSSALDLDLWLLNPRVERLATSDSGAQSEPESIETALTEEGQYIILVRDFNGEAGDYTISLAANPLATPRTAGNLTYGDSVMGAIRPGASVAWTFYAQVGDVININAQPAESSSDLIMVLRGPGTTLPLQVDDKPAGQQETISAYVVPTGGPWQIVLQEFFGESAGYMLGLERAK